jgi:hypothetical protein
MYLTLTDQFNKPLVLNTNDFRELVDFRGGTRVYTKDTYFVVKEKVPQIFKGLTKKNETKNSQRT